MSEDLTDERLQEIRALVLTATTPNSALAKAAGQTLAWSRQGRAIDRLTGQAPTIILELLAEVSRLRANAAPDLICACHVPNEHPLAGSHTDDRGFIFCGPGCAWAFDQYEAVKRAELDAKRGGVK